MKTYTNHPAVAEALTRHTHFSNGIPIPTPTLIADIGACCGVSTRILRNCYPQAKIHAYEPVVSSYLQIGPEADEKFLAGLSSHRGVRNMVVMEDPRLSNVNSWGDEEATFYTLDEMGFAYDYLHIDVEGHELEVLRGAIRILTAVRWVKIECRLRQGVPGTKELIDQLFGFTLTHLSEVQTTGLIKFNMNFERK